MILDKIEILELELNLKKKFKHSLYKRKKSSSIIVRIYSQDNFGIGESIPREYVTGENAQTVIQTLKNKIIKDFLKINFSNYIEVLDYIQNYIPNLKKNELCAFACFEIALINLIAKEFKIGIEDILKYLQISFKKNNLINYSAVIGENNLIKQSVEALIIKKRKFKQVKIKVNSKSLWKLVILKKILNKLELRIDANCSFLDIDTEKNIHILNKLNINLIEQPFEVNGKKNLFLYKLYQRNKVKLILDESFCSFKDLSKLESDNKEGDIVNLRISKNGGIISTLLLYKKLKEKHIPVILGCMVGETVLSRYNLILARYLNVMANEGLYDKYLFKEIIFENPQFNQSGDIKCENCDLNFDVDLNSNYIKCIKNKIIY